MTALEKLSYLLLQIRRPSDPMRHQEITTFAKQLACDEEQITVADLVGNPRKAREFQRYDMVLIGGSGDFSVVSGGDWLPEALDCMRELVDASKPTFASCWGFQALARALGGEVVTDLSRAEIGTPLLRLTEAGSQDDVFGILNPTFVGCMGHQDIVDRLPDNAVRLALSDQVENEAFRIQDKPIYATQFHPELTLDGLLQRLRAYPEYVEKIAGVSEAEFERTCVETPEVNRLLRQMVEVVFG